MRDLVEVYYLSLSKEPQHITRWAGRKYVFKKPGIYKVPAELADDLLANDPTRFGETKEVLCELRGIDLTKPKKAKKVVKSKSK